MAFCTNCGTALSEDGRFCQHCGAPRVQMQERTTTPKKTATKVFGRVSAGVALCNGIVGLMLASGFALLAAGFMSTQPSMPVVAIVLAPQPILAFIFAHRAKNHGCTNKMARTGVILAAVALLLYAISIPVLFCRL